MTYTLSLALTDFLPVAFSAVGMFFVARMVAHLSRRHGRMALLGATLIVVGGFIKAVWKTIMAATNGTVNIVWMDDGLFVWMAPGFVLMAWAVLSAVQLARGQKPKSVWVVPLVIIASMFATSIFMAFRSPDTPTWSRILLGSMVLATVATSVLLVIFAVRQKMPFLAGLFILNLIGVFALNGMARMPDQTIALQWVEEVINAVSWLAFAFAAYKIYQHTRAIFGVA